jgi:sugar transferase (PEP-CTERM/EpsH1 system associated)
VTSAVNLLHLTHRLPYPPDKGDRIRTYHTLRYLASRARVHLAALADEPPSPGAVEVLEKMCARVAVVPHSGLKRWLRALGSLVCGRSITEGVFHSPGLARLLESWCGEVRFDGVLVSSSALVPYLRRGALGGVPAVVDLVDVDSQKWFDYAQASRIPKRWLYRLEGRRLRKLERSLPGWARGVVLTTPAEVALYEQFAGAGTARVMANGVDLDYFRPAPQSREVSCVFVGALDYRPNVDGVVWFCEAVWPKILQRRAEAKLYIVGRQPVPALQKLGAVAGVEVVGTVPDVRPWVERAAVAVVPLRIARGVQNKVLEALAMTRAVVASPVCLGGLQTVPGKHLLAATTPEEWTATLLALFDDEEQRQRLGAAGRAFVEEHHCWDRCLTPLGELLLSGEPGEEDDHRHRGRTAGRADGPG